MSKFVPLFSIYPGSASATIFADGSLLPTPAGGAGNELNDGVLEPTPVQPPFHLHSLRELEKAARSQIRTHEHRHLAELSGLPSLSCPPLPSALFFSFCPSLTLEHLVTGMERILGAASGAWGLRLSLLPCLQWALRAAVWQGWGAVAVVQVASPPS